MIQDVHCTNSILTLNYESVQTTHTQAWKIVMQQVQALLHFPPCLWGMQLIAA
jgi:hypothetical protein